MIAEQYQKKEEKEKSAAQKALLASLFKEVTEVKLNEEDGSKFLNPLNPLQPWTTRLLCVPTSRQVSVKRAKSANTATT